MRMPRDRNRQPVESQQDARQDAELEALQATIAELQAQLTLLRNQLAQDRTVADDEERTRLLEHARAQLPELDDQFEKGLDELRRLAAR